MMSEAVPAAREVEILVRSWSNVTAWYSIVTFGLALVYSSSKAFIGVASDSSPQWVNTTSFTGSLEVGAFVAGARWQAPSNKLKTNRVAITTDERRVCFIGLFSSQIVESITDRFVE